MSMVPIYLKTNKQGYKSNKGQFHEYGSVTTDSIVEDNNLTQEEIEQRDYVLGKITNEDSFIPANQALPDYNTLYNPVEFDKNIRNSQENVVSLEENNDMVKVDTTKSWSKLKSQPVYTEEGVNTMRTSNKEAPYMHFGNPFSQGGYAGTIKMPTVQHAREAYKEWLLEESYQKVNPEQRAWILEQINSGKLDNATLLYDSKLAARGLGTHAHALAEVINEKRNPLDCN